MLALTQETCEGERCETVSKVCGGEGKLSVRSGFLNLLSVVPFKAFLLPFFAYRKILSKIPSKKNIVRFEIIDFIIWIWVFAVFYGTKGFSTWQKFPLQMLGFSLLLCLPAMLVLYMRREKYLNIVKKLV